MPYTLLLNRYRLKQFINRRIRKQAATHRYTLKMAQCLLRAINSQYKHMLSRHSMWARPLVGPLEIQFLFHN